MAKLIVEAGGSTRRFKLGDGTLTLGSGEGATLTLASEELADVHAEIEVSGESVVLRTRKGTMPPKVRGVAAKGDVKLGPGVKVTLGDVTLSLEGPAASAAPSRTQAASRGADKAGVRASSGRAKAEARPSSGRATRPRVQRRQPTVHGQSLPSWLIVVLILAVAGVGFLIFRSGAEGFSEEGFSAIASETRLQEKLAEADFRSGRKEIDKVKRHWNELDPTWHAKFRAFEEQVIELETEAELLSRNSDGDVYISKQLEGFLDDYLEVPSRPAARVFIKRINWFEKEYPRHPRLDWCSRMKERWRQTAALNEPASYEDVAFEVKTMTWSMPRDYKTAFALLDGFISGATGSDRAMAQALRTEHEGERREYFQDRLLQAKHEYGHESSQQKSSAVRWLTELVTKIGDDDMANQAASYLVKIPGVDGPIRGFYNSERHTYDALMENPIVRRYVEENDVLAGT